MAPSVPVATYRVQLTKDLGFRKAAGIVPYLKELGITHLYASPFLAARPGSTHGYDIVDHNRLNPELGGEEGFTELCSALAKADLGLILDFVPNHMGVGQSDNRWWLDVLEYGQRSRYARFFDIEWQGLPHRKQPGVLLPILGKPYGEALDAGEIELKFDPASGSFAAWYYEHKLPIDPARYRDILHVIAQKISSEASAALKELAERTKSAKASERGKAIKAALAEARDLHRAIEDGLSCFDARTPEGRPHLHRLLERQHYHLASWRLAFSAINYRRFFDVNDLAGLRPEHQPAFDEMHRLVAKLIAEGQLQGIRLDHIDGLLNPVQYLQRLQRQIKASRPQQKAPFYLLVEKILEGDEPLPPLPGIAGTTGYERLNVISNALLAPSGLASLEKTWRYFTGEGAPFEEMLANAKIRVIESMLASEFTVLNRMLSRIAAGHLASRDFAAERLHAALRAYVIRFPVYRTYITPGHVSPQDRALIARIIAQVRRDWSGPDEAILEFLEAAINTDLAQTEGYSKLRVQTFALKLQQFTGPLMAKSLEDTTFYRYNRLIALNEVGGEPAHPLTSLDTFHERQREYLRAQPHALTATATHDTKRGEDARMRILALSELANEWDEAVKAWSRMNERFTQTIEGIRAPSRGQEFLHYQALLGAWSGAAPGQEFVERVCQYAIKAAREEKRETSWTVPNERYEKALVAFLRQILDAGKSQEFLRSFDAFAQRVSFLGRLNSFSQLGLKVFLPGVPDFYQGTELWDFSFVDPDNRRPVDFEQRRSALSSYADNAPNPQSAEAKFWLTRRLLAIRNEHAELLRSGGYEAVTLEGPDAENVITFRRGAGGEQLTILCGRHFAARTDGGRKNADGWQASLTLQGPVEDLVSGQRHAASQLQLSEAFAAWPVAVLKSA